MFKKEGLRKYSIKKLSIGAASVFIGSIVFLGTNAHASDEGKNVELVAERQVVFVDKNETTNASDLEKKEIPNSENKIEELGAKSKVETTIGKTGEIDIATEAETLSNKKETVVEDAKVETPSEKKEVEEKTTKAEELSDKKEVVEGEIENKEQTSAKTSKVDTKEKIPYNALDKRVGDSSTIKELLTKIINENLETPTKEDSNDNSGKVELKDGIISKLTEDYAKSIAKGYIGLEGAKYDNLIYENKELNPDADDDKDGILNKDELYIYRKNGRTYLGYNTHPKLIDTDGDGIIDSKDKDQLVWNISARDMALFMNLAYADTNNVENILTKNVPEGILKTNIERMQNNELAPYWAVKKVYHEDNTKNGFDAYLFETKNEYPFLNGEKIQVLAIAGTNTSEMGDLKADAALVLGNDSNQSVTTKELIKTLERDKSITNLYITGHSLGGYLTLRAAAQATNDKMKTLRDVYTFNAPKLKSGTFSWFGTDEIGKERKLTDDLAKKGKIKNYYTENDDVIVGFLRPGFPDNKISIGKSEGKHSSTSYFETRMNKNSDFNVGVRQGVDGVGRVDVNVKKFKVVGPKNGTLAATFLPTLIDKNPISIMIGDEVTDKDILARVDKSTLPVNISLSLLEKASLSSLGMKINKVKVSYLDDNTTNEIDVPILVSEANKEELTSVVNAAESLVDKVIELNDKTADSAKNFTKTRDELVAKLKEAEEVVANKLSSQSIVNSVTKNLANLGLDFITKRDSLELLDFAKYSPKLKTTELTLVKKGQTPNLLEVVNKVATENLPKDVKYEVEDISKTTAVGKVNVKVKIIYADKSIGEINVPYEVYVTEKGEANVEVELPEYPLSEVPTYSEKGEANVEPKLEEYPVEKVPTYSEKGEGTEEPELPEYPLNEVTTYSEKGEANVEVELPEYPLSEVPTYSEKGEANVEVELPEYPLSEVPTYSEKGEANVEVELPEYPLSEVLTYSEKGEANVEVELPEYPLSEVPTYFENSSIKNTLKNGDVEVQFLNKNTENLKLSVEEIKITNIEKLFAKNTVVRVLDLKITKDDKVQELTDERTVKIVLLSNKNTDLEVYHIADGGKLTKLDSKVEGDKIIFKINHFSIFAVVEKKASEEQNANENLQNNKNTKKQNLETTKEENGQSVKNDMLEKNIKKEQLGTSAKVKRAKNNTLVQNAKSKISKTNKELPRTSVTNEDVLVVLLSLVAIISIRRQVQ